MATHQRNPHDEERRRAQRQPATITPQSPTIGTSHRDAFGNRIPGETKLVDGNLAAQERSAREAERRQVFSQPPGWQTLQSSQAPWDRGPSQATTQAAMNATMSHVGVQPKSPGTVPGAHPTTQLQQARGAAQATAWMDSIKRGSVTGVSPVVGAATAAATNTASAAGGSQGTNWMRQMLQNTQPPNTVPVKVNVGNREIQNRFATTTPSTMQALEVRFPGYGQMTPDQRAATLRANRTPNSVGRYASLANRSFDHLPPQHAAVARMFANPDGSAHVANGKRGEYYVGNASVTQGGQTRHVSGQDLVRGAVPTANGGVIHMQQRRPDRPPVNPHSRQFSVSPAPEGVTPPQGVRANQDPTRPVNTYRDYGIFRQNLTPPVPGTGVARTEQLSPEVPRRSTVNFFDQFNPRNQPQAPQGVRETVQQGVQSVRNRVAEVKAARERGWQMAEAARHEAPPLNVISDNASRYFTENVLNPLRRRVAQSTGGRAMGWDQEEVPRRSTARRAQ